MLSGFVVGFRLCAEGMGLRLDVAVIVYVYWSIILIETQYVHDGLEPKKTHKP